MLIAAAAAGVLSRAPTWARQGRRPYRVGVLSRDTFFAMPTDWSAFVDELSRLGYVDGRNLIFDIRPAAAKDDLDRLALELVNAAVDVIFAFGGTPIAVAAKRATPAIPIVFYYSPDPVGYGLVRSFAHPGTNLTGTALPVSETLRKNVQILAQATGKLSRVAVIHPAQPDWLASQRSFSASISDAARRLGIQVQFVKVDAFTELAATMEALVREGIGGVISLGVAELPRAFFDELARLLVNLRLPSVGEPESGFLLSYGYSASDLAQRAARYVGKVLKGSKPADLPVEQVTTFELVINLRTARAIGLSIPSDVLIQATRLIQ